MIKLTNVMNKKEMREFEVQSAMNTLQRAQEIQRDSKLMGDVKKAAMAEVKKLQSLAGSTSSKKTLSKKKTLKRK
tara:strand:- start:361 stop:585 length:225 start_codon:yes stop_codon:yes gene_type:complete